MNDAGSPRIYTKTGDDGTTGRLFGGRIGKDDLLVEVCGDVDEAVAALGTARAALIDRPDLAHSVLTLQRQLFVVGADLMANPRARDRLAPRVSQVTIEMIDSVEQTIDRLVTEQPLRPVFIVPGATTASAALDLARAIIRRAERHSVRAHRDDRPISVEVATFLNRASDLAYVLARHAAGTAEEPISHT